MRNRSVAAYALLAGAALLASGCETADPSAPAPMAEQAPPKQVRVHLASFDHDIHFAPAAKTLTSSQASNLSHFLTSNAIGERDAVSVESAPAASARSNARQAAVLAKLKNLQIQAISGTDAKLAADTIRVHADRSVVLPPGCPDWTKPEADEPNNAPSSNYGCATEVNLAAMVANPADLVKPAAGGKADAAALARGVELYRAGGLAKTLSSSGGYSSAGLSGVSGPPASGGGGQ